MWRKKYGLEKLTNSRFGQWPQSVSRSLREFDGIKVWDWKS